ncbi:hypothetical protein ILUMI_25283 [Ignelater luminosus]|uniref:VPS37 C-terminal domain-containing protein n=1 Tax=Ignelater luminosus TaxID=2038154 RepID=A0A8K0C5R9_IGNLU|nr:hypothetical protein ILUMI_25283 [Ignelater luminosus]
MMVSFHADGAPGLLDFTVHLDLRSVMQSVIREFERTSCPLATEPGNNITSPTAPARVKVAEMIGRDTFENERLNATYQMLSEKYSPRNIKDQLQQVAEKSNIESKTVAETFFNGEIDVE